MNRTLLIADDHELIRGGLKQVLNTVADYHVIETANGSDALRQIREMRPDVAILDIQMPGMSGYEVAQAVRAEKLPVSIIFLTMHKDETMFNKALDIGAKGYVLKENTTSEILQSVAAVLEGRYYLSPAISDFLVQRNMNRPTMAHTANRLEHLSPAERRVLKLLSLMKTNQDIAADLHISVKTVQNHRNNICGKLGLNGAHALLRFAVEHSGDL